MALGCVICEEVLDGPASAPGRLTEAASATQSKLPKNRSKKRALPAPTETDLVVSPCGHMFHEVCISKWFNNKSSTGTCPVCRKCCTRARLLRLYPSHIDEYEELPPVSTTSTSTEQQNCNSANGVSNTELEQLHKLLIADYTELQQKYNDVRDANELMKVELESSYQEINKLRQNVSASQQSSSLSHLSGAL